MLKTKAYFAGILALVACGNEPSGTPTPEDPGQGVPDPGVTVSTTEPTGRASERAAVDEELSDVAGIDGPKLRERYPTSFGGTPTYDPNAIVGLDEIQASPFQLDDQELAALTQKGFFIDGKSTFPTFAYGYSTVYMSDLPVYISADSILESMHRSYDRILQSLEEEKLSGELAALLSGMRTRLSGGTGNELGGTACADADVFLAVALSLLQGNAVNTVAGGSHDAVSSFVSKVTAASGAETVVLFGVAREEDFSQYKPRGHYTQSELLKRYFRAMMWLGRVDFRMLETQMDGTQLFRRRQLEGALVLNELVSPELRARFDAIDETVRVLVGEPDYMTIDQVGSLLGDIGAESLADVAPVPDDVLAQAILDGGYGMQRISSHIMVNGLGAGTLPLSLSFAFLGQRYVIDSHVFSNVVYDRAGGGSVMRMMPNPLDVAFAVLENDQALTLLAPELERYAYAPDLAAMRLLVDEHPSEFWNENLYNRWLGALRELSPAAVARSADADALPPTFKSEAWGRHLMSSELASWAELRHNTILYAKQSYTGGATCEFPDGYVDPYPEFYAKVVDYATLGRETVAAVAAGTSVAERVDAYFENLGVVAGRLRDMATHQRTGAPYTQDMLDFLNDAVVVDLGCGDATFSSGWYKSLFFRPEDGIDWHPTIADVHTQPTDEGGTPVGKVLHVGTGNARPMVVVAETCSGPHAYVGMASSYYEHVTENFERLDDDMWGRMVYDAPDVPWMTDLVSR